jgi:tetratricopeptide (TPR) repeat protein
MLHALPLLLAQTAGAWVTGRPPECGDPGGRASNVWERAKAPELRRYCDLVASASSKLAGAGAMAQSALESAREADSVLPGRAAPLVLEGRALAAQGKYAEALAALSEGKSRDSGALDEPQALLAWARALGRNGRREAAAEAYRALLPRSTALSTSDRVSAEIEAGLVAMARGTPGLDEAAAAFRDAVREAQDDARMVAVLALALALDRRGSSEEARTLLGERMHGDPRDSVATSRAKALLAVMPFEAHAMSALALESTDAAGARDAWQQAIDGAPQGPWLGYARAHLATLTHKHPARGNP